MMGRSPLCYMPSFVEIGPLVLEKISEGFFLPYMEVAAILVMCPRCCEQNFVPPTQGGSTYNLALIGQAVLEEKMFENMNGRTPDHGYTISSGEQKTTISNRVCQLSKPPHVNTGGCGPHLISDLAVDCNQKTEMTQTEKRVPKRLGPETSLVPGFMPKNNPIRKSATRCP